MKSKKSKVLKHFDEQIVVQITMGQIRQFKAEAAPYTDGYSLTELAKMVKEYAEDWAECLGNCL